MTNRSLKHEGSPLVDAEHGEVSTMQIDKDDEPSETRSCERVGRNRKALILATTLLALLISAVISVRKPATERLPSGVVSIEQAQDFMLDIGSGLSLWCRTWGNRESGVPVLFVHGGPGNAISDYGNMNKKFFDAQKFWVVEVDQRGTGKSQPSVREDWRNMKYYKDVSIDKMSGDYERVRVSLGIDRWLVFGGSWGSTLSLDYSLRYPERCLGLILRGIYLNTKPEFDAVFTRRPYLKNPRRLKEFDTWFDLAAKEASNAGEEKLDPNDGERFFRLYERMIERGDSSAVWKWHAFEHNLMTEDPQKLLDPNVISRKVLPEARSVAFFEARLFLHGTFEDPVNMLSRVESITDDTPFPQTWVCQGVKDEVCPEKYALKLVTALESAGVKHTAFFVNSGHEASSVVMSECLINSVDDFVARFASQATLT